MSRFIEHNGREYEIVVIHPKPKGRNGTPCRVHVDHGRQVVELAPDVPKGQRMAVARAALSSFSGALLVPLVSSES